MSASPGFVTSHEQIEHYGDNRRLIQMAALGSPNRAALETALTRRQRLVARLRSYGRSLARLRALLELLGGTPQAMPCGIQRVSGRPLPLIAIPAELSAIELRATAVEEILSIAHLSAIRHELTVCFERARWKAGDTAFRTVDTPTGLSICGENSNKFQSLVGICHELGHVLYERRHGSEEFRHKVGSEAYAQIFEHHVVDLYLRQHAPLARSAWRDYQAQVDALNLALFRMEAREILGYPLEGPFDLESCAFRESYLTAPGYQTVYALASHSRRKLATGCR